MQLTAAQIETCLKYADLPLPRHTSYPTVPFWQDAWPQSAYTDALRTAAAADLDFGLYVHVPFCRSLCFYCACNKEIIPDAQRAAHDPTAGYLKGIATELTRLGSIVGEKTLHQLHLGGGTPTFLTPEGLHELWRAIAAAFAVAPDAEVSVEVDPRVTTEAHLQALRHHGVSRLSFGIQDFDANAQAMVNRIQPYEMVRDFTRLARGLGFSSINFDLIYGLPGQTLDTVATTLDRVLELSPDRIAFYRLAVIPDIFKWQRTFSRKDLPRGRDSLSLMLLAIRRFMESGYRFIGLDHFAKPNEGLAKAMDDGHLQRTFQGMTTGKGLVTLAVGPSAIASGPEFFAQNAKSTREWLKRLDGDSALAVERGMRLSTDDRLRAAVLQEIYGYGRVNLSNVGASFGVDTAPYFDREWAALAELEREGLVVTDRARQSLAVTDVGRLMLRVVGAVFDGYLPADAWKRGVQPTQASSAG